MLRLTGAEPADRLPADESPRTLMSRWALATLVVLFLLGAGAIALARLFGRSGSRASIGVSIIAHWLGAYVLWSFAAGLAVTAGLLTTYQSAAFAAICLLGALFQYRAHLQAGRDRGLAIFVGVQLAWLVFVLFQNGMLTAGW
jgi:amino acid transporter